MSPKLDSQVERVARRDAATGAVHYYLSDHLNSTDIVTNASGGIEEESDYYPFGGERVITDTGIGNNYKFTGKERDPETGLDDFEARYYNSALGRFVTPDWAAAPTAVPYADFGNPQSLNLYLYVKNNPETLTDPDGHAGVDAAEATIEEVNEVVKPLIESAAPRIGAAGPVITALAGVGIDIQSFATRIQADSDLKMNEQVIRNNEQIQQNEAKEGEPKPAAAAPPRKGGGRNAQKSNLARQESAQN